MWKTIFVLVKKILTSFRYISTKRTFSFLMSSERRFQRHALTTLSAARAANDAITLHLDHRLRRRFKSESKWHVSLSCTRMDEPDERSSTFGGKLVRKSFSHFCPKIPNAVFKTFTIVWPELSWKYYLF